MSILIHNEPQDYYFGKLTGREAANAVNLLSYTGLKAWVLCTAHYNGHLWKYHDLTPEEIIELSSKGFLKRGDGINADWEFDSAGGYKEQGSSNYPSTGSEENNNAPRTKPTYIDFRFAIGDILDMGEQFSNLIFHNNDMLVKLSKLTATKKMRRIEMCEENIDFWNNAIQTHGIELEEAEYKRIMENRAKEQTAQRSNWQQEDTCAFSELADADGELPF